MTKLVKSWSGGDSWVGVTKLSWADVGGGVKKGDQDSP